MQSARSPRVRAWPRRCSKPGKRKRPANDASVPALGEEDRDRGDSVAAERGSPPPGGRGKVAGRGKRYRRHKDLSNIYLATDLFGNRLCSTSASFVISWLSPRS